MGFERGIWLEGAHERDADVKAGLLIRGGAIGQARLILGRPLAGWAPGAGGGRELIAFLHEPQVLALAGADTETEYRFVSLCGACCRIHCTLVNPLVLLCAAVADSERASGTLGNCQ